MLLHEWDGETLVQGGQTTLYGSECETFVLVDEEFYAAPFLAFLNRIKPSWVQRRPSEFYFVLDKCYARDHFIPRLH